MKAEEYIERREASLKYVDARKAVELARKEERDKAKNLIREAYNALNGLTGLDVDKSLINESSLSRRLREYLVEEE